MSNGGKITLTITMHPEGKVDVNGPLENKVLCYGLLRMAELLIYEYKNPSPVVVPKMVPPRILGPGGGHA